MDREQELATIKGVRQLTINQIIDALRAVINTPLQQIDSKTEVHFSLDGSDGNTFALTIDEALLVVKFKYAQVVDFADRLYQKTSATGQK